MKLPHIIHLLRCQIFHLWYWIYWTSYVGPELEYISHEQTPLLLRPIPRLAGEYMKDQTHKNIWTGFEKEKILLKKPANTRDESWDKNIGFALPAQRRWHYKPSFAREQHASDISNVFDFNFLGLSDDILFKYIWLQLSRERKYTEKGCHCTQFCVFVTCQKLKQNLYLSSKCLAFTC